MEGDPANLVTYGANLTNLNLNFNDGAQDFGLDAGNAFYVDNASIVQIPEPGVTAAFLAMTAVGFLRCRRA